MFFQIFSPVSLVTIVNTCMLCAVTMACVMTAAIHGKLAQLLIEGQNWEKNPTNVQGVFLLKLLASKQSPYMMTIYQGLDWKSRYSTYWTFMNSYNL